MQIHEYNQMMKYLVRREPKEVTEAKARKELNLPKDIKLNGSKILNWINFNNKMFGNNKMPLTEEELKIAADVEKSLNKSSIDQRTDTKEVKRDTKAMAKLGKKEPGFKYQSWADQLEERTRPTNKTPETKKILVAKKPTPIKPLKPLDPLYDWRLAPWYDYPDDDDAAPEEDKTKSKKEKKEGITSLI